VYDGDELRSVVPHSTDDGVRGVDDCLASLRAREGKPTTASTGDRIEPETDIGASNSAGGSSI
jgi:hypothetical protein